MSKPLIKQLIESKMSEDGMFDTGIKGVQLFRVTSPVRCAPAVYEPSVIAIVSGAKEAILDGKRYVYDNSQYMCCSMSMPVEAGTPTASPEKPLLGVSISLSTKVMTELAIEMENASGAIRKPQSSAIPPGFALSEWDDDFSDALLRLLQLGHSAADSSILGEGRLHLNDTITIDEMASQIGMSRAVLHRKFKEATSMSPIQFVKSMRLNTAAMKIATGTNVSQAAMEVGYVSSSQFSREFKRMYGQSPKQWSHGSQIPDSIKI